MSAEARGIRTRVIDHHKPPDLSAGTLPQILWKSTTLKLLTAESFLHPSFVVMNTDAKHFQSAKELSKPGMVVHVSKPRTQQDSKFRANWATQLEGRGEEGGREEKKGEGVKPFLKLLSISRVHRAQIFPHAYQHCHISFWLQSMLLNDCSFDNHNTPNFYQLHGALIQLTSN